jgi:hypothetical protein
MNNLVNRSNYVSGNCGLAVANGPGHRHDGPTLVAWQRMQRQSRAVTNKLRSTYTDKFGKEVDDADFYQLLP